MDDLDRLIRAVARRGAWRHRGTEPGQVHVPTERNPCEMVITGSRSNADNYRTVTVRCRCMAEPRSSPRYYGYDPLGVVANLRLAHQLWEDHARATHALDEDVVP